MRHFICSTFIVAFFLGGAAARGADFGVTKTLQIGGEGSWDYLTVDAPSHRLYVPRSTHTLVLDEETGKTLGDIAGQKRAHGVAVVPAAGRGFISDGTDASVVIFDLKTSEVLGKVAAAEDADGIIYDPASDRVLVVCGDAGVLIPIKPDVDPKSGKADPAIELGGKPEFLAADGQGKAFVNLVDKDQVVVVDTKAQKVLAHWPVAPGGQPVGMSMDTEKHHLFIGCRRLQKLVVMNSEDGKVLADLPIGAGVDATKFDAGHAFASCRDSTLAVVAETSPGKFEVVQTVQTKPGARTMGVDPMTHTIYLPTSEMQPAQAGGATTRPTMKPGGFMIVVVGPR